MELLLVMLGISLVGFLSIARIHSREHADYYLNQMQRVEGDYYLRDTTQPGELPGIWMGRGAARFGLLEPNAYVKPEPSVRSSHQSSTIMRLPHPRFTVFNSRPCFVPNWASL